MGIVAYGPDAAAAKQRGEALRDALVAAGVGANRFQVTAGKGAPSKARAAEVVVAPDCHLIVWKGYSGSPRGGPECFPANAPATAETVRAAIAGGGGQA